MISYQPIKLGGKANIDERVIIKHELFQEFFILIKDKEEL
jgi:hypothetical protein